MLLPTEHLGHVNKKCVVLVTPLKYLGSIGTYSFKKKNWAGWGYMFIRYDLKYYIYIKTIASFSMYPLLCLFKIYFYFLSCIGTC